MSQYLPTGDFRENKVTISSVKIILRTPDNDEHGFLIECDLDYPSSIHEKTKYFPFLPDEKTIKVENFSLYMTINKPEKHKPTKKLIMDQTNKQRYFLHYRDLKFYIRHGIRIVRIHTVYKFKQSPWLAKYIKDNTERRNKAKTEFEKHFYKLMNISFYGKTIENIRKRLNLDLIEKSDTHRILNRQPKLSFIDKIAEYEKFSLYSFNKESITFTKPIYVGFSVLELSKHLMYEWYYDKMQPYFGEDSLELHYLDTDSFIFSFKPIKSLIEDLKYFKEDFDFSDLDPSHELYSKDNKKVVVKMKLETSPELDLDEAVFLSSKPYSLNIKQDSSHCKHKGVQDHNKYTLEDYKYCLENNEIKYGVNYSFRSNKHEITMVKQKEIALNTFHDKRFYIDKYISVPWGQNLGSKMTQKNLKIFIKEIYSKGPRKYYPTNKTDVYHIDNIWSLDILDLKDYGPKNNRGYRYVLVTIDNFSKFGFTVPLKNKNAQTIKDSFENIIISAKRKPNLIEIDRGKEFYNNLFQDFLNRNNIKLYSRNTSLGAVFAEPFNRTIRDFLKRPVFEKGDSSWIDVLPTITKQYNNRIHTSTKLSPKDASLKKNEGFVYNNLLDKRKKVKPEFQINDLVRVADLRKTFSKSDRTHWFYKLYKISEIINDTIPSYRIDNLKERYNESLLKKTELTMKENDNVMKKLNIV